MVFHLSEQALTRRSLKNPAMNINSMPLTLFTMKRLGSAVGRAIYFLPQNEVLRVRIPVRETILKFCLTYFFTFFLKSLLVYACLPK